MASVKCPLCDAPVSPQELSEGWCESCGKKLPPSLLGTAVSLAAAEDKMRQERKAWAFAGWFMAGVVLGPAAWAILTMLFDLKDISAALRWTLVLGCLIGGPVISSATYLILARRNARVVTVGLYLVLIISLVLSLVVLAARFAHPAAR